MAVSAVKVSPSRNKTTNVGGFLSINVGDLQKQLEETFSEIGSSIISLPRNRQFMRQVGAYFVEEDDKYVPIYTGRLTGRPYTNRVKAVTELPLDPFQRVKYDGEGKVTVSYKSVPYAKYIYNDYHQRRMITKKEGLTTYQKDTSQLHPLATSKWLEQVRPGKPEWESFMSKVRLLFMTTMMKKLGKVGVYKK